MVRLYRGRVTTCLNNIFTQRIIIQNPEINKVGYTIRQPRFESHSLYLDTNLSVTHLTDFYSIISVIWHGLELSC